MNKILKEKVLNELVKEQLIDKDVVNDMLLTKNDFPSWYWNVNYTSTQQNIGTP